MFTANRDRARSNYVQRLIVYESAQNTRAPKTDINPSKSRHHFIFRPRTRNRLGRLFIGSETKVFDAFVTLFIRVKVTFNSSFNFFFFRRYICQLPLSISCHEKYSFNVLLPRPYLPVKIPSKPVDPNTVQTDIM